jgi:hypothetical protein
LSEDFKEWLSKKMLGVTVRAPDISSIVPLGRVFKLVHGNRYFGFTTLLRVSAISIIAFVLTEINVVSYVFGPHGYLGQHGFVFGRHERGIHGGPGVIEETLVPF